MSIHRVRTVIRRFFEGNNRDIEPDEIFLDSHNLPAFDRNQFEGRLERPIGKKVQILVTLVFALILFVYAGRIAYLSVYQGEAFAYLSENNRLQHSILFAERGVLYDRNNIELAWNEAEKAIKNKRYAQHSNHSITLMISNWRNNFNQRGAQ